MTFVGPDPLVNSVDPGYVQERGIDAVADKLPSATIRPGGFAFSRQNFEAVLSRFYSPPQVGSSDTGLYNRKWVQYRYIIMYGVSIGQGDRRCEPNGLHIVGRRLSISSCRNVSSSCTTVPTAAPVVAGIRQ